MVPYTSDLIWKVSRDLFGSSTWKVDACVI